VVLLERDKITGQLVLLDVHRPERGRDVVVVRVLKSVSQKSAISVASWPNCVATSWGLIFFATIPPF